MELSTKQKVIVVSVYTLLIFALGRYSNSYTLKQSDAKQAESSIVKKDNDKTEVEAKKDIHKETTTVSKVLPDGTKETTTKVVEDTHADSNTKKDSKSSEVGLNKESEVASKTIERGDQKTTISVLAGVSLFNSNEPAIDYGLSVTKPVLGPIAIGLWALKSGTVGASCGIQF